MTRTSPASLDSAARTNGAGSPDLPASVLSVQDHRTGHSYDLPISEDGPEQEHSIRAVDLRQMRVNEDDFGLLSYDPAFMNTASCRSAITYIDGDKGILRYRGYPIEDLAGRVSFLDVAYLLIHGELPTPEQSAEWAQRVAQDSAVPAGITTLIETFPTDAHPMAVLMSAMAALGAYRPEAKAVRDREARQREVTRLIGAVSTLAGMAYRRTQGRPLDLPKPTGDYGRDFLSNLYADDPSYQPQQALVDAINVLFVLHADHEQNCSTSAVRGVGSSEPDPYSTIAAGIAALYGPLHGGANEAVCRQLHAIGSPENVAEYVRHVKAGERRLMGFGHRVYKNYDPRARIIQKTAEDVFAITGLNPLLDVAVALEKIALDDEYFKARKLYPNVDFYSGIIYEALGLPVGMFTVLFAVARTAGWTAQWIEMLEDDEQKIARPRQIYVGPGRRAYAGKPD